jgi:hypothetical protein
LLLDRPQSKLVEALPPWTAVATTLRGFMLWPAVILRVIVAEALLPQLVDINAASQQQDLGFAEPHHRQLWRCVRLPAPGCPGLQ